ncbi:MAG: hypothetical protein JWR19_2150 [Pedosphaera sp.]|nr:hypothetical protein [Pedosphaera sp.]
MPETYPDITWKEESKKVFAGSDYQSGSFDTIRSCKAEIDLAMEGIRNGADPIKVLEKSQQWLAKCLYCCNMNNAKDGEADKT